MGTVELCLLLRRTLFAVTQIKDSEFRMNKQSTNLKRTNELTDVSVFNQKVTTDKVTNKENSSQQIFFGNAGKLSAKTLLTIAVIIIANILGFQTIYSQTAITMINAAGGPAGSGPSTAPQVATLYQNATTAYSPAITATYSFSNQQYAPTGSTPTPLNQLEGLATSSGMSFGGNINSGTAAAPINSPIGSSPFYNLMNGISAAPNGMFTSCNTCAAGTGIDVTANRAVGVFLCSDALITAANADRLALNSRVYYGDMTITFNRPVSNPVLQFVGMGGQVGISNPTSGKSYDVGFATEFDLVGTNVSFTKLSGNSVMNVTSNSITNTATRLGANSNGALLHNITRTAASGSVVAVGTNVTSITLKLYLRGDGGVIVNTTTGAATTADAGFAPHWSFAPNYPTAGSNLEGVSGDLMLFGVSLQKPVTISGNVFNDVNGLTSPDLTVNGVGTGLPSGTQLYANLVDANGKVITSATVSSGGVYTFDAVNEGSYTMQISTNQGSQGVAAPAIALPAGWVNTGENTGTAAGNDGTVNGSQSVTVAAVNITNINFGIEQPPTPATNTNSAQVNPGGTVNATVPATLFSATDPTSGTISSIRITAFPTNATSIAVGTTSYYPNAGAIPGVCPTVTCAVFPGAGISVTTNAGGNPTQTITVDPINGTVVVGIPYKATDNAGIESTTDGSANMPFSLYSIGNRIWYDTNNNGRVDAAEFGIGNISVSVFGDTGCDGTPDGAAVQTLNTDANGYYRFDGLAAGCYLVRVNSSNFSGTLNGYKNTTGNVAADTDSDVTNAGENGINPSGALNSVNTNGVLSNTITLGPGAVEPTGETDVAGSGVYAGQGSVDNQADMTVDFGFYEMCLCGTIWSDVGTGGGVNNNGIQDGGELGIPSVRVRVYDSAGVEIPVGDDGILGTADDANGGVLTDATGKYRFVGLEPGDYRIAIASGNSSSPTNSTPNDNVDLDDNGFNNPAAIGSIPAGWVVSHPMTMTPGGEPLINNADGTTANVTLDMGLIAAPSAVKMDSFEVYTDGSRAVITWATGSEFNNLGFNVYRENDGKRELLTKTPIAGAAFRASELQASGEAYQWIDNNPVKGAMYSVEDVDMSGAATMHAATAAQDSDLARFGLDNSKSLADVSQSSNEARFETATVSSKGLKTAAKVGKSNAESNLQNVAGQTRQLEIAQRGGLKVEVKRTGWYRVSAAETAVGNLSGEATNWQLYANGSELPMVVNADNSIEFYGQNADSRATDAQAYYVINGTSAGLRLKTSADSADGNASQASSFTAISERKDRTVYAPYLLNGEKENWFGPSVYTNNTTIQTVEAVNLAATSNAKLTVKLQGYTANQHAVRVVLNEVELGTAEFVGLNLKTAEFNLPANLVREGENKVELTALNPSDVSLVESVKIAYLKQYKAVNDSIRFTVEANSSVAVDNFTNEEINVYELENGIATRRIMPQIIKRDEGFSFVLNADNVNREFVALTAEQAQAVAKVEENTPSNLASADNGTAFIIIAPKFLARQAEQLAIVRRDQKISTQVVLTEDIYDEFSYGLHDGQAIENFLRFANTNWKGKPSFVLLFGDSSADSKGYLTGSSRDFVPTEWTETNYMETASDSGLADFNNDDIEDLAIGRLPVGTEAEADLMLAKLARYDAQGQRGVKTNLMIADSEFGNTSDEIANRTPSNIVNIKLNRTDLSDADLRGQIQIKANESPLLVSYFGHGNTSNWTNAGVFNKTDALNLTNEKLSFYLLMTCLNGYTHSPYADSLAESLMRSTNGAVAVVASPNLNLPSGQQELRKALYQLMLNPTQTRVPVRFGTMVKQAKTATTDKDVRKSFLLIGDPTVVVK
jgi:Peptidase family C25/SdrD B-like domain